jgi:hypothetical protein
MAGDDGEPLFLRRADAVDLGLAVDFHLLLRAIEQAMPPDATLALEGTEVAPAIARYLVANAAPEPRALEPHGDVPGRVFHLPLAGDAVAGLRVLAEEHVASEVADHLTVYRDDEVLLWAHDAGGGRLHVARSLPAETVAAFRDALAWTLKPRRRGLLGRLRPRRDQ